MSKIRCEGKRQQRRGNTFGIFKCTRIAKGSVETQLGFTRQHSCCGDQECISSIAQGYPVQWKAL